MVENKNDVLFGTSVFGGFNRKDVIEYIDKLQRSAMDKDDETDSESARNLRTAQVRVQTLSDEVAVLQAENKSLRDEVKMLRDAAEDPVREIEKMQAEIERLQKELDERNAEEASAEDASADEEFFEAVEEAE